jgi:hypothetical protein
MALPKTYQGLRTRPAASLPAKLDRKLLSYAAAAAAAGVGALALTQPAEAKVIFTASHIPISPPNTDVPLDPNHDGVPDFYLNFNSFTTGHTYLNLALSVRQAQFGNGVGVITTITGTQMAAQLGPSRGVGSFDVFETKHGLWMNHQIFCGKSCTGTVQGPWQNQGGFLGLKFVVSGQTYYGWAHITIGRDIYDTAYIDGYAFNDTPNSFIETGDQNGEKKPLTRRGTPRPSALPGPSAQPALQPATLGHFSAGAEALPLWRRPSEANVDEVAHQD